MNTLENSDLRKARSLIYEGATIYEIRYGAWRGWTLQQVAELLGTNRSVICKIRSRQTYAEFP